MQQANTIIIGAGPTGLSAAYHLNGSTVVLESTDRVGGLCRSFKIGDVVFDIGGHSFHTAHENVRSLICDDLGVDLFLQRRDARILFKGDVVPYPWQRFFHLVKDHRVIQDCHTGLETREPPTGPANLQNFILAKYGAGIAQHFLFPYNRKLWLRDLDEISCDWTSERVAGLRNERTPAGDGAVRRKPLDENSIVGYPSSGGFDQIFRKMAAKIDNILFDQHVCFIDPQTKVLMTRRGNVFKWETIVSTMPIPDLVGILQNTPSNIVRLAGRLPYVSLQVDFFVTTEPLDGVPQRLYCADADMPAHKISFNSLSSQNERDKPCHSIIAETSIGDPGSAHCRDRTGLILRGLSDARLIKGQSQILTHRYELVKYAYPVQSHQVRSIMNVLSGYLECHGIYSVGRFGNWEYINSDDCLLRGRELAEHLDSGAGRLNADAASS
jgi:UDP-galactopyranose mutase